MLTSLIGGALVALAFLLISVLRGSGARTTKRGGARSEVIESMVAVTIVCLLALGLSLVISSVRSGWIALLLGLAVAVVGSILAVVAAPPSRASEPRQSVTAT